MKSLDRTSAVVASRVVWAGRLVLLGLAGCTPLVGGCDSSNKNVTAQPAVAAGKTDVPTAPRAGTSPAGTRVKAGVAPLNYMVGSGGALTVYDVTDNKTLVQTAAPVQALVNVDDEKGVSVANVVVKAGPLPKGHRYELWLK